MARWLLGLEIVATLAANVAHGAGVGLSVRRWPHGQVALVRPHQALDDRTPRQAYLDT